MFVNHRQFMASIALELADDSETKQEFFKTIFEKMHLELTNIKPECFRQAEVYLEITKTLLEFEGAG